MENIYSPAWPHSEIKEVLPNIFYVVGTNITKHNNIEPRIQIRSAAVPAKERKQNNFPIC
jgi:hypothetical protein